MSGRRHNSRLVKIHYSYTTEEAASLLGIHKNTLTQWRRQGLKPIDDRRPVLFQGGVLRAFWNAGAKTGNKNAPMASSSVCAAASPSVRQTMTSR